MRRCEDAPGRCTPEAGAVFLAFGIILPFEGGISPGFPLKCLELIRIWFSMSEGRLDGRESIKDRCLR